jgi:Cathepsin propeptide inhibitor domain (I29)
MKLHAAIVTMCVLCDAIRALSLKEVAKDEWNEFKLTHKKVYDSLAEEQYRYNIYLKNREVIAQHNQRFALGLETYDMGVNHLSDMTYEEILQRFAGVESS